jgi:predicted  nucleic acid-binding Zn-ribbon protein
MESGSENAQGQDRDVSESSDQPRDASSLREQVFQLTEERDTLVLDVESKASMIEFLKKENDALKLEVQNVRVQLTEERDALVLDAERKASMIEFLKEENDALKVEVLNVRVQREDDTALNDKLSFLLRKCNDITAERDALLLEYRRISGEKNALRDEARNLRDQFKDPAVLQEELNALRVQRDDNKRERDAFELRARQLAGKCSAMTKVMESLQLENEKNRARFQDFAPMERELNNIRQQCENITNERKAVLIEMEDLKAKIKDSDELETQLRNAKMLYEELKSERDLLKTKIQSKADKQKKTRAKYCCWQ